MSKLAKALTAAAGNAAGESLYVEDVFSTYLYTGNSSTQTITNGIDLDGEGGLVWTKRRDGTARTHILVDTERGAGKVLNSDGNYAEYTISGMPSTFNSDGYTITSTDAGVNDSSYNYASWTFRKAEKFFDVVTYTGDGATLRNLSHSLNGDVGAIIIKRTDSASDWYVLSRDTNPTNGVRFTKLNSTAAGNYDGSNHSVYWTNTTFRPALVDPTATNTNINGATYVAYLFASDAGGFGDDGSESIIKCGSYTGNGSSDGPEIDLGFEPQFIVQKAVDRSANWYIYDSMRGIASGGNDNALNPNSSAVEYIAERLALTASGFKITTTNGNFNQSGENYIYIAIRRPMKTPESGTEVFAPVNRTASAPTYYTGFVTDMQIMTLKNGFQNQLTDRLRGQKKLLTNATDAESAIGTEATYDWMTGVGDQDSASSNNIAWNFKRATGFFDVVAYTGDGVAGRTVAHNLGVAPELFFVKRRNSTGSWYGYTASYGGAYYLRLNASSGAATASTIWNDTDPTSSVFTVGSNQNVNNSNDTYIAYLFASVDGVSKVGSYTGTGSNVNVDCGFSAGARFILIKRTDSSGDWYVWDSARGIVAGNDPYLLLNSTAAEVTSTDYIDPLASGFKVTSSAPAALNASGGTYIFLAIA